MTTLAETTPLDWLDWLVVALYGLAIFAIAAWAMRKIHDPGGFLLAKRKVGRTLMIATGFAGGTSAQHPIGVAASTYQQGLSGMWLSLTWIMVTPFYWIYPPVARRLRVVTVVDMIRMRFGPIMDVIFKVVSVVTKPISMGLGLKSAAIVVHVMTGGQVSETAAIWIIAIPTLAYTLMGGVLAAYATDALQGLLIVILSFLLIPFAISAAGGPAQLDHAINDELTQLISTEGKGLGIWWIFWFLVSCLFAAPLSSMGGNLAARSEMSARLGIFGGIVKRFCTVGWGLAGLFAIAIYGSAQTSGLDADNIFAHISSDLLPVALRGLMVASILGAVMSSLDGGLLSFAGLITKNFYEEYAVQKATPSHYLLMTRIFAGIGMLAACWFALDKSDIVEYVEFVEPLASLTGVAIMICFFWRRMTGWGAVASVVVMLPIFFISMRTPLTQGLENLPWGFSHTAEWLTQVYASMGYEVILELGENKYLPIELSYPMYLIPGLIALIVVSYLTKQHDQRAVDMFYARLDTPLGHEHLLREQGYQVDDLVELDGEEITVDKKDAGGDRLILVDLLRLPGLLWRDEVSLWDYRTDLIGLVVSLIFVLGFLAGVQYMGTFL